MTESGPEEDAPASPETLLSILREITDAAPSHYQAAVSALSLTPSFSLPGRRYDCHRTERVVEWLESLSQ